jgi:hypothetical protein
VPQQPEEERQRVGIAGIVEADDADGEAGCTEDEAAV